MSILNTVVECSKNHVIVWKCSHCGENNWVTSDESDLAYRVEHLRYVNDRTLGRFIECNACRKPRKPSGWSLASHRSKGAAFPLWEEKL